MHIMLTGVSCVGKSTIGKRLAGILNYEFYDMDIEGELFFNKPIRRQHRDHPTGHSFRQSQAQVLQHVLSTSPENSIIALPPYGLMQPIWPVARDDDDGFIVVVRDSPENVLARLIWFDLDSNQIEKTLTESEKVLYLREIKRDMSFFNHTYKRADAVVDITDCNVDDAVHELHSLLLRLDVVGD